MTFCSYNAALADRDRSAIENNVKNFLHLCNKKVSGCKAKLNASAGPYCWSCEQNVVLTDLPVLKCTPATLLYLTYALLGLIVVKELTKVLMLVAAVCCSKGERTGSDTFLQRQRHFFSSSAFLPAFYCCGQHGHQVVASCLSHQASWADLLWELVHGALLHSVPLLLLSLYFNFYVIKTGIDALVTATISLSALSAVILLAKIGKACTCACKDQLCSSSALNGPEDIKLDFQVRLLEN
eukprot:CAMPEP_0175125572 /NCGR_PEP_ID=MMETSP0087-20121206/3386_1 /TAXON_ID=136419 /ORGANISM="Unknown Unknown, Strain D1" /LENGTH=238 /DNA_ID=CAMNT_0016407415 /DNA_START=1130 /DNA_END=1846 /DNA_ORIENTATION=-